MAEVTLEKAVRARLEGTVSGLGGLDAGSDDPGSSAKPAMARRGLAMEDMRVVAERHYNEGCDAGYKDGYGRGREHGEARGARDERSRQLNVSMAFAAAVAARLDDLTGALGVQKGEKGGKDKRTRGELREAAQAGLDALRAEIAVVVVKLMDNAF
jgi:hypothetical protein